MLIDDKCVFSDSQAITTTADSTNKVNVMPLLGKGQPVLLDFHVVQTFLALTSLKVEIQQADTESGDYTATSMSKTITLASGGLAEGEKIGFRFLSRDVTKPWLKVVYTVTGSNATAGKIFAAIVREEQDSYEAGQYINRGAVVA